MQRKVKMIVSLLYSFYILTPATFGFYYVFSRPSTYVRIAAIHRVTPTFYPANNIFNNYFPMQIFLRSCGKPRKCCEKYHRLSQGQIRPANLIVPQVPDGICDVNVGAKFSLGLVQSMAVIVKSNVANSSTIPRAYARSRYDSSHPRDGTRGKEGSGNPDE